MTLDRLLHLAREFAVFVLLGGLAVGQTPSLPRDTLPLDLAERAIPFGLPTPADWELSGKRVERMQLGRRLFFDPILSADRTVACASCHQPEHGFASPEALPLGVGGQRALRHAPTLINRVYGTLHSWDGRSKSLREQALLPIANEVEMGLPLKDAIQRLLTDPSYARAFEAAYGVGVTEANLGDALAVFMERLTAGDSPVDRFRAAVRNSLNPTEKRGLWIYESKGQCWQCHTGPNFSDEKFHNTGIGAMDGIAEPGRAAITQRSEDHGRFKTPTLRGLTRSAPYMHDGSLATLADVVEFYRRGGNANAQRDSRIKPLDLTDAEAQALVAFLEALSRTEDDEKR